MCPEVHLADRDRYRQGGDGLQGWRASKLVVYTHGPTGERPEVRPRVIVGYYVEKGTGLDEFGPVDPALWDWPRFLDLLRDPARRLPLELATQRHDLRVGDYDGGRYSPSGANIGFTGRLEDAKLVMRNPVGGIVGEGWNDLARFLDDLPDPVWRDLHIWREWPADVAIAMGQPFATREMVPVLLDLARVYLDSVGPIRRS